MSTFSLNKRAKYITDVGITKFSWRSKKQKPHSHPQQQSKVLESETPPPPPPPPNTHINKHKHSLLMYWMYTLSTDEVLWTESNNVWSTVNTDSCREGESSRSNLLAEHIQFFLKYCRHYCKGWMEELENQCIPVSYWLDRHIKWIGQISAK